MYSCHLSIKKVLSDQPERTSLSYDVRPNKNGAYVSSDSTIAVLSSDSYDAGSIVEMTTISI